MLQLFVSSHELLMLAIKFANVQNAQRYEAQLETSLMTYLDLLERRFYYHSCMNNLNKFILGYKLPEIAAQTIGQNRK